MLNIHLWNLYDYKHVHVNSPRTRYVTKCILHETSTTDPPYSMALKSILCHSLVCHLSPNRQTIIVK